ncbi:MAG: trypsin-like peptidase domain-containing protein, partial [Thermoguttaceae bacterium]
CPVQAIPIAPEELRISAQDRVISVGCDGGADPTIKQHVVISTDRIGTNPQNAIPFKYIQVSEAPVSGRSGGGLFAAEGFLIGVCNTADPVANDGHFVPPHIIREFLKQLQLSAIYENPSLTNPISPTTVANNNFVATNAPELPNSASFQSHLLPLSAANSAPDFAANSAPNSADYPSATTPAASFSHLAISSIPVLSDSESRALLVSQTKNSDFSPVALVSNNDNLSEQNVVGEQNVSEGISEIMSQNRQSSGIKAMNEVEKATLEEVKRRAQDGDEVILIVRSRRNPDVPSDVIVLSGTSDQFVDALAQQTLTSPTHYNPVILSSHESISQQNSLQNASRLAGPQTVSLPVLH